MLLSVYGKEKKGEEREYVCICLSILIYSVLVVQILLDFGSLFVVLILHLGRLAAVLVVDVLLD
jgi:hypothetical protein